MKTVMETFSKTERLCSNKIIKDLFEQGHILHNALFKVVWNIPSAVLPSPGQIAISVSKRGFRKAVTRNLLKRRIREAYRKNKYLLYNFLDTKHIQLAFVIILKGTVIPDYSAIEKSVQDMLRKLIIQVNETIKEC